MILKIPKKSIFMDGHIILADAAMLNSLTPGVMSGAGAFETIRVLGRKVQFLAQHLNRLCSSLEELKVALPFPRKKFNAFIHETLKANSLKDARLRLTVWEKNGVSHISIVAEPYKPHSESRYEKGFRAMISGIRRNEEAPLTHIKSINYRSFLDAYREAERKGYDEAILLNRKGEVVEGSRTNVFMVQNKILWTPNLSSGCLKGIVRQIVLTLARQNGIKTKNANFKPESLLEAQEAFVTNSLIGIMPLTTLNGNSIQQRKVGPITARLMKSYQKLT